MNSEVLIAGAGPTGLMLAIQLARHGVRPRIIDRHGGPAQQTRAMVVHARTLEIYDALGIAREALDQGAIAGGANIWADKVRKARLPIGAAGEGLSPFPFVLMLGQDVNERIMGDKLRALGVDVQWNTELTGLRQHADGVTVTMRGSDGQLRQERAKWVAGCDGSRSGVREGCGIAFPGAPYEHVFFVADTEAEGPMVAGELNAFLWRKGFHLFFPMRGHDGWRVIGILPAHLQNRDDLTFDDLSPDLRREVGGNLRFSACHWFSTYRIQHRCAARFRDRRCFLLGDAAHIHSPMGGQGMNTGLQDAYNLAWKLAYVIRGKAQARLLDSYEAERMPVAQALLRGTDRAFGMVVSDTALAAFLRTRVVANLASLAMRSKRIQRFAFRAVSQVGIRYRDSPLSHDLDAPSAEAPHAGDRFPWLRAARTAGGPTEDFFARRDDTRFSLVAIGQRVGKGIHQEVEVHDVAQDPVNVQELARWRITAPSFFLVRPDGYIGLTGKQVTAETMDGYLARIGWIPASTASSHASDAAL